MGKRIGRNFYNRESLIKYSGEANAGECIFCAAAGHGNPFPRTRQGKEERSNHALSVRYLLKLPASRSKFAGCEDI